MAALTAFAQRQSAGEDPTRREMLRTGGDEGLRINRNVSLLGDFSVAPILRTRPFMRWTRN